MCFPPQWRALFRHLKPPKVVREWCVFVHFDLEMCFRATTACTFSTSQLPKVVREWCVLYILTWKCASRHNGVHFFDISTSKSGPTLRCFVPFHLEMCFAPQRRALFRHLNFQKWSEPLVFCIFWLGNVLRATTACNFSSLIWPAGSAPAALASLLFDPPEPQIIGKNTVFRDFPTLSRICIFFLLILSLLTLLTSAFSTVHIVGSFTSKLPSISHLLVELQPQVEKTTWSIYLRKRTSVVPHDWEDGKWYAWYWYHWITTPVAVLWLVMLIMVMAGEEKEAEMKMADILGM